jgi:outer membrane protein assembly factor BamE (lipoprotein component of BamABCDE complex)
MRTKLFVSCACLALCLMAASAARSQDRWSLAIPLARSADSISAQKLAQVVPGTTTKTQVKSLLGEPWRILQFNDCGMSMPGEADETWDYRGKNAQGTYRLHIEFDDHDVASLVAKIPDHVAGGKGTRAKVAPGDARMAMKM